MSLRDRIVLTLLVITAILAAPAAYAVVTLRDLRQIAESLRTRDNPVTRAIGSFSTAMEALDLAQRSYVGLGGTPPNDPEYELRQREAQDWLAQADSAQRVGEREMQFLYRQEGSDQYERATLAARRRWEALKTTLAEERSLTEQGAPTDAKQEFRTEHVLPAFTAMGEAVDPIQRALQAESEERTDQAAEVATRARNTALTALGAALVLTLVIGAWLTRSLLRPIGELRRGMAHVAEGDFEPQVPAAVRRPDELGDLARSFGTMAEQLAELDRLKAEFVSVASHEIKTPLSVIRGYVSLLADGIYGPVNDQQKKTLKSVSDQTDRLTRLVHRLLDISRFEAGGGRLELRPIVLRDFFADLTDDFRVLAIQNGIKFPVQLARDLPETIVADPDRLNEVLGNILSNAFKFTERGGSICLDARRDGGGIVVEVEDTGVGIPPEKLPRIFEKFFQVENEAQPRSAGSGLGLAIAREIVEAHGGTITAESRVGEGTKFRVTLPERPPVQRAA